MNPVDASLQKLLAAASSTPRPAPQEPPPALECAVIAQCRARHTPASDTPFILWMFQRATLLALIIMTLSGAWNYFGNKNSPVTAALVKDALIQLPP
jgi:hypothetical protein